MIVPSFAKGKTYAVLGLGKSGLAAAQALSAAGATVLAWDDSAGARKRADVRLADLHAHTLDGVDALVLSPGIPHTYPKPHPVVEKARALHIPVIGDVQLLFEACPQATYVGVTGTNGKSTTTALIAHILKTNGRAVEVGGNLGTPALSLAPHGPEGIYVLELSSYQLELIHDHPLAVGVLLNITPDHLDRHGGMDGYQNAKALIARTTGPQTLVIGIDDAPTRALAERLQAPARTIRTISVIGPADVSCANGLVLEGEQKVIDARSLTRLPGAHNAQNICAAYAACRALGLSKDAILAGIESFPGLAHRQQLVATVRGVRFINDSKATNADAAARALDCYPDIYWILGGKPKETGLDGLDDRMQRVRHAFVIGEAEEAFSAWLAARHVPFTRCGTLEKATHAAAAMAFEENRPHPVVLLSPACASFDQFAHFEHRGDTFVLLVHEITRKVAA